MDHATVRWTIVALLLVACGLPQSIAFFFENQYARIIPPPPNQPLIAILLQSGSPSGPRPKLLTEYGNLIIESANDANITLRTIGRGNLLVNGVSLTALIGRFGPMSPHSHARTDERFAALERSTATLESLFAGNQSIAMRVRRLENQYASAVRRSAQPIQPTFSITERTARRAARRPPPAPAASPVACRS